MTRGGAGTYVHVGEGECGSNIWRLEPVEGDDDVYKIYLDDPQHRAAGTILSASGKYCDKRNGNFGSVYVYVAENDNGEYAASTWRLAGQSSKHFKIYLAEATPVNSEGISLTGLLAAHGTVDKDQRDGRKATYVHLASSDAYGSSIFRFEKV